MAKKAYKVISPLRVSAEETIEPGESVEIEEKQAVELIECGVLERPAKTKAEPKK